MCFLYTAMNLKFMHSNRLPRASTRIYEISLSLLTEAQGQHDLGRTNIGSLLRYASSNATRYGMRQCVGKHREKAVYFPVYGFEDEGNRFYCTNLACHELL